MMRRERVGGPQLKEKFHQQGASIYYCYKRWACNPVINGVIVTPIFVGLQPQLPIQNVGHL